MTLPAETEFDELKFDPEQGTVIRDPEGSGYGHWAGGHKVFFDAVDNLFVLFYRERSPLEHGRGGRCAVATSQDGVKFEDVWSADKSEFAASSIEVGHCVRDPDGEWRLYVSYEVAGAGYWRIDMLRGSTPAELDTQGRRTVLMPFDYGMRSLKDPFVVFRHGRYWLYLAGPGRDQARPDGDRVWAASYEATLLARSDDGVYFPDLEWVFEAPNTDTWHGRRARLNSTIPWQNGWLGFYDGGRTSFDMYEEWCGLAWSDDGVEFERLEQPEPWLRSLHGCVRYLYALERGDERFFYYEYTREDGAHDLRVFHA
ncbi:MAG: hypothetical protein OES38_00515 [Gammaproteobacteria bacterium]|nr:hypothetical protein [Gammaproteobacteria bacterium]